MRGLNDMIVRHYSMPVTIVPKHVRIIIHTRFTTLQHADLCSRLRKSRSKHPKMYKASIVSEEVYYQIRSTGIEENAHDYAESSSPLLGTKGVESKSTSSKGTVASTSYSLA